jgi:hypothetical protein
MLRPALNDPSIFPDDAVLAAQLGLSKPAWDDFLLLLKDHAPQLSAEWRYYNDGKSWLCKVTRKATTVLWVAAWDKYFTVASYLNVRAEPFVIASSLSKALKDDFLNSAKKTRAIRVEVRKTAELDTVEELLAIKLKLKCSRSIHSPYWRRDHPCIPYRDCPRLQMDPCFNRIASRGKK